MKLPLGIQHFTTLREEGYVYVDKTEHIYRIISSGKFYFMSRPRRFGKSLTISTMHELYRGNRALFEGLWIADKWDWQRVRPVIWLRFSRMNYQNLGLEAAIAQELYEIATRYGVELPAELDAKGALLALFANFASYEEKIVLLVDEYDKPIIDYLDDVQKMLAHQTILKTFYSTLKDEGHRLELLFITGVSAFS